MTAVAVAIAIAAITSIISNHGVGIMDCGFSNQKIPNVLLNVTVTIEAR